MVEYIALAVVIIVLLVVITLAVKRKKKVRSYQESRRPSAASGGDSTSDPNPQLYVGNLSYRAGDSEVREFFEGFGTIETVRVIKDRRTGRSKGFAFVTFSKLSSATKALGAHGQNFSGRSLIVRYAKPSNRC